MNGAPSVLYEEFFRSAPVGRGISDGGCWGTADSRAMGSSDREASPTLYYDRRRNATAS